MKLGLLTALLVLIAAALQAAFAPVAWLGGVRPELLPAAVVYAALSLKRPATIVGLAAAAGLAQDALSAAPFGLTMATFGIAALVLWRLRDFLDRSLPWVQLLGGAFVTFLTSAVAVLIAGLTFVAFVKLLWIVILNALVTVVVFFLMDLVRLQLGIAE